MVHTCPPVSEIPTPTSKPDDEAPLRYPETLGKVIEIRSTPTSGLGIFALHSVPPNTLLLSETPLLILLDSGTRIDPLPGMVKSLSPARKKAYLSLYSYRYKPHESIYRSILYSNGFGVGKTATGVFETASRFNHSCVPNARFGWDEERGRMVYVSKRKIERGEEITVNYGMSKTGLKRYYGFECGCERCRGEDAGADAEVESASGSQSESEHENEDEEKAEPELDIGVVLSDALAALEVNDRKDD
ncbi:SET domain-containing 5 protein [Rutstroemia sp. NJR-2017a BBW]|nr:SET domain-containing 5 protein [Rutstroemia sp. NJR-2017a BBW]PQE08730.1 SET domain-containing 5 protein [Rutstroemia sp. NJR-2017a BBW]